MLKNKFKSGLIALAFASVFSAPVSASTINLAADGVWQTFDVDSFVSATGGVEWIDAQFDPANGYIGDGSELHFVFTLTTAAYLTVVDGGFAGDQFEVFDNGASLGFTSQAVNSFPDSIASNFDAALANPDFSRGVFFLSAGQHDITGLLSLSALDSDGIAFDATVGAVRLSQVPVPASLGLFLAGNALIGMVGKRRRSTKN